jgi:membrane-associated protein
MLTQLMDLFHRIYDVQGIVRWGGLLALVAIIFSETGLLVGFFLPGDSLLVTAGIYCNPLAAGEAPLLNIVSVNLAVMVAAIVGDTVGYWIGAKSGPRLFTREQSLLFSRKHLLRTKDFYERHGGKTIIIARFMPFARTFAPVVAGIGRMSYRRFLSYNVFGGIGWVFSMTMLGFLLSRAFPTLPKHIDKVIVVIIAVSLIPGTVSWLANRKNDNKNDKKKDKGEVPTAAI